MAENNNAEFEVRTLLALYASICAEMLWRHQERYRLLAQSLVITAVLGAFFAAPPWIVDYQIKILALSIVPLPYVAIMGLILKEHQYINMRDWYFRVVLWPRLASLIFESGNAFPWLVWHEFEARQTGRVSGFPGRKRRLMVFLFLEIFDYAVPALFASLATKRLSSDYRALAMQNSTSRRRQGIVSVYGFLF